MNPVRLEATIILTATREDLAKVAEEHEQPFPTDAEMLESFTEDIKDAFGDSEDWEPFGLEVKISGP